jgi:hypothetical protein
VSVESVPSFTGVWIKAVMAWTHTSREVFGFRDKIVFWWLFEESKALPVTYGYVVGAATVRAPVQVDNVMAQQRCHDASRISNCCGDKSSQNPWIRSTLNQLT